MFKPHTNNSWLIAKLDGSLAYSEHTTLSEAVEVMDKYYSSIADELIIVRKITTTTYEHPELLKQKEPKDEV